MRAEVSDIRETLVGLDRFLSFLVPVANTAGEKELREEVEYVHDQIDSLEKHSVRLIDDMRHLLDLFTAMQAEEATKTQERIAKNVGKLTIVTLVGAVMGTMAGVFGMNTVASAAPLIVPYEFSFVIIVVLAIIVVILLWRLKWLKFS